MSGFHRVLGYALCVLLAACSASPPPTAEPAPSASASASAITLAASPSATAPTSEATTEPMPTVPAMPTTSPADAPTAMPLPSMMAQEQPDLAVVTADQSIELVQGDKRKQLAKVSFPPECGRLHWSPDGYRIAFEGGVYTFGSKADEEPRLSPIAGKYFRWSPDGQQLAWLADVDEHLDVIRVGGADGDAANVVGGAHWGYTGDVAWSPDGQVVAAGPLQAAADGAGFKIIEGRGRTLAWSPDGSRIAWTTAEAQAANSTISIIVEHAGAQTTIAQIPIPLPPESAAAPQELYQLPLRWLPDGTAVLVPVPTHVLLTGGGTYLVRDGTATLVSPHVLCDLAPDSQRMVARTADDQLVIVRLADGVVEAELGPGVAAAWRPALRGSTPTAPLAAKSPTLALGMAGMPKPAITELQQRLAEQGYDVGAVDGVFGQRTEQAVRTFQQNQGLAVDGVVGPQTWAALRLDAERTTRQFTSTP